MSHLTIAETTEAERPSIAVPYISDLSEKRIGKISEVCDVFEFRGDCFDTTDMGKLKQKVSRLRDLGTLPILLTLRWEAENGRWRGSESERFRAISKLLPLCDGVDIEINAPIAQDVVDLAKAHDLPAIGSYHNFEKTPELEDLFKEFAKSVELGTDYTKVATMLRSKYEYRTLRDFTKEQAASNIITVGMGEKFGPLSRIELMFTGSKLTYAAAEKDQAIAPGQIYFKKARKRLTQTARTRIT